MSTQISTTKRQRTRSQGAICFEVEQDGETQRVRVARDTDPSASDMITTSEPDAREYGDALPALPLPGSGERLPTCGVRFNGHFCPDCGTPHSVGRTCGCSRCPRCWQSWAFHRAKSIASKLEALGRHEYSQNNRKVKQHHLTVSFRDSTRFNSKNTLDRAIAVQKQLLAKANVDTGYLIYHAWRIAPEYRGEVMGHESGSGDGDMNWPDVLEKVESDEWSWEAVKDEFLVYAPHFHVICLSEFVQTGAVVGEIEDETGIVIHRITTEREDGKERSIDGIEELCKVTAYSLSHAGIAADSGADGSDHAAVRPFGKVANFSAFDAAKADVNDAMRSVAGTVLGVDFSTPECSEQVPDHVDHDHSGSGSGSGLPAPDPDGTPGTVPNGSGMASPSPGSGASLGSGSGSGSGSGGGSSGSSSGGGFGAALAADADTGTWEATEGMVPPSMTETSSEETSACGGTLVPIWAADDYLGDLEWTNRIEDRFGEDRIHELRTARREWAGMGKPVPETDPSGSPDPDPSEGDPPDR